MCIRDSLWEETLNPAKENLSSVSRAQRFLSRAPGSVVLRLTVGEEDISLYETLFEALQSSRYDVQPINDWNTPINSVKLIR